jgi:hypothetical protein
MGLTMSRVLASGCAALFVFSSAAAWADPVVVAKHENLEHYTVNNPTPAAESYSPFFTTHTDGVKPFLSSNGWAPIAPVQAADPSTAASTTPKKSFSFVGDSTAAGNWTDGNGIPAGITLAFDAQFTISAMQTESGMMLTVPGASNTNQSGRGIGLTVVAGGVDDINPGRGLLFSPVTVSNVSFTGTLADPGYTFTPGSVSNFGVQLIASGVFNETSQGMLLTQGEDTVVTPGEETIGFGVTSGTLASNLRQDLNFGIYQDPPPDPLLSSSAFPRQSGPFTLVTTVSSGTIRGFTLGYDVAYDISAANATEDADFDVDGDVDGDDFLTWQRGVGVGTELSTGDANDDNVVNSDDLAIWRDQFGATPLIAAVSQIPEPAGAALLIISGIAMLAASRRQA